MKLICDSKYLLFPASHHAQSRCVYFRIAGELVYDLVAPLDSFEPDYVFPLNVERFHGKEIDISIEPAMDFQIQKSNQGVSGKDAYSGKYRPLAHFTAKRGWLNDPNGLVFYQGKYLMFYQHNPVACTWENMHWGYAVSCDLIHWEEQEIALYPDETGTMFSGSAIIDEDNVTGLKENENDAILLFYTAAGFPSKASEGKPFTHTDWGISLLGFTAEISAQKGLLTCMDCSASIGCGKHVLELRILLDTIYAEVFANRGNTFLGVSYIQDSNLNHFIISSHKGSIFIEKLSISSLKPFWS